MILQKLIDEFKKIFKEKYSTDHTDVEAREAALTFFHNSDDYLEVFTSKDKKRPTFYWFGYKCFNHLNPKKTAGSIFIYLSKIPKKIIFLLDRGMTDLALMDSISTIYIF